LTSLSVDLDTIVKKLFKICTIKNPICSGLRIVDNKFVLGGNNFSGSGLGLSKKKKKRPM